MNSELIIYSFKWQGFFNMVLLILAYDDLSYWHLLWECCYTMNITSLQDILMHGDVTFHICAFLIIKSLLRFLLSLPKQSLGDLLFLLRFLLLSLPNKVWGTYCFCSVSYYYSYSFFPQSMNLSTADLRNYRTEFHETWWSYRYMFLVDPKVFRFVVKGVKAIFLWVQRGGGGYYRILWETWNFVH